MITHYSSLMARTGSAAQRGKVAEWLRFVLYLIGGRLMLIAAGRKGTWVAASSPGTAHGSAGSPDMRSSTITITTHAIIINRIDRRCSYKRWTTLRC